MTKEELEKVFDWLEKNMNKQNYFEFVLTDKNQITAYWKNTRDGFAQFYIKPILELIKENEIMYYKIDEELYNKIKEITGSDYEKYGDFINAEEITNILKDLICEIDSLKEGE